MSRPLIRWTFSVVLSVCDFVVDVAAALGERLC